MHAVYRHAVALCLNDSLRRHRVERTGVGLRTFVPGRLQLVGTTHEHTRGQRTLQASLPPSPVPFRPYTKRLAVTAAHPQRFYSVLSFVESALVQESFRSARNSPVAMLNHHPPSDDGAENVVLALLTTVTVTTPLMGFAGTL